MYAIIEDSGTQIRVAPGDVVDVDLRDVAPKAKTITFDRVLLLASEKKGSTAIGTPYVDGAAVKAEVLGEVAGVKIDVIKYKRRKGYKRKQGHRQRYLRVKIDEITTEPGGSAATTTTKKKTTKKTTKKTAATKSQD